jgi:hypothetical protein
MEKMSHPLLSILIPTVVGREKELHYLQEVILMQILGDDDPMLSALAQSDPKEGSVSRMELGLVEIVSIKDNKEMTIGEKREWLYKEAKGTFCWQIDDDDSIAIDAIPHIINAIRLKPQVSCITFKENCMINGTYYSSCHSLRYPEWMDNFDGFSFVRTPFYKDVIRTDIAQSVPFEYSRYGEDNAWSKALYPLLSDEIHIDQEIYFYIHNSKPEDFNLRYGFQQ